MATITYRITINSVDRTTDVLNGSIVIEDVINDQSNSLSFELIDRSNSGIPSTEQEVIIIKNDIRIFGGTITRVVTKSLDAGVVQAAITCTDYTRLLDSKLVHKNYEDYTDKAIIEDIVSTYASGLGITTTNVVLGLTIDQISFNYIQPSQALRRLAELAGRNWYIDYNKDIHYFPATTNVSPFNITDTGTNHFDLEISKDSTQVRNRVYVRGGTYLSDYVTISQKGDGVTRQFLLPDKPHSVTLTVNGVSKTLGVKNVNTSGYQYYVNFEEKYIEQDTSQTILTTADTIAVTYKYDIPVLVAVEDPASIASLGYKEFAIFDQQITDRDAAKRRAVAELTDYANNLIEGSFKTYTDGFISGQYINIISSKHNISADYVVQRVTARSLGGGLYEYSIAIASAKTLGIIKFLIELLELNRNLVKLSTDEVVDELIQLTDSIPSDSLTDALTIDSQGAYFTWCPDSISTTPQTRLRWGIGQWG